MKWPCGMSLGKLARSTSNTWTPWRARSIASDDPAHLPPTMITSCIRFSWGNRKCCESAWLLASWTAARPDKQGLGGLDVGSPPWPDRVRFCGAGRYRVQGRGLSRILSGRGRELVTTESAYEAD